MKTTEANSKCRDKKFVNTRTILNNRDEFLGPAGVELTHVRRVYNSPLNSMTLLTFVLREFFMNFIALLSFYAAWKKN